MNTDVPVNGRSVQVSDSPQCNCLKYLRLIDEEGF